MSIKRPVPPVTGAAKPAGEKVHQGSTRLRSCLCDSSFQDGLYGAGIRVHVIGKRRVTCTVCGTEKVRTDVVDDTKTKAEKGTAR